MQVNKALHTCTSWYAYAAMFGSSPHTSSDGGGGLDSSFWLGMAAKTLR